MKITTQSLREHRVYAKEEFLHLRSYPDLYEILLTKFGPTRTLLSFIVLALETQVNDILEPF